MSCHRSGAKDIPFGYAKPLRPRWDPISSVDSPLLEIVVEFLNEGRHGRFDDDPIPIESTRERQMVTTVGAHTHRVVCKYSIAIGMISARNRCPHSATGTSSNAKAVNAAAARLPRNPVGCVHPTTRHRWLRRVDGSVSRGPPQSPLPPTSGGGRSRKTTARWDGTVGCLKVQWLWRMGALLTPHSF